MNRRSFVSLASCGAALALLPSLSAHAQSEEDILDLASAPIGRNIPATFTGLSYELAQLTEPSFFNAGHQDLISLFRQLSPSGVLRLGGNSSEFCWFQATYSTPPPQLHIPPGDLSSNWMPHRLFAIQPQAVDALAGFLQATGWKVIYGLNFGNNTPARAAMEAAYAAKILGPHLLYFQIGNEPDFYRNATNGTRPPGWGFADYRREWMHFANAIAASVPNARFGGPDVGASSDWIVRFAREVAPQLGSRLAALTGHYYAEGPPDDPKVTTARLLAGDPRVASSTQAAVEAAGAHAVSYRMTEGNSCYRGGKPGMSNAFAASLWAADYLLSLASLGCCGVNLHGGDSRFLSAGLGDHDPGLAVATGTQPARNGFYTPIRSEQGQPTFATPVFYGMMLAQKFAGATMLQTETKLNANASLYAAKTETGFLVAIVNKDRASEVLQSILFDHASRVARALHLTGPALDATSGVTFGGATANPKTAWQPHHETLSSPHGSLQLKVPAASATLLEIT